MRLSAFFPPHNCPLDGLMEIGSALCLQSFKTSVEFLAKKDDKAFTLLPWISRQIPSLWSSFKSILIFQHHILAAGIQLIVRFYLLLGHEWVPPVGDSDRKIALHLRQRCRVPRALHGELINHITSMLSLA